MYIVIIVFYLKGELIINGNKQKLMIIKELFERPVVDTVLPAILLNACLINLFRIEDVLIV